MKIVTFNAIGKLVKDYRIKKGWSQTDLSALAGMKRGQGQHISNIERGLANLPPKHGSKVCQLLEIDTSLMIDAMVEDFKESLVEEFKSSGETK